MSLSLYRLPLPKEVKEHNIGYLKYEIGRYLEEDYNGHGGSWEVDESIIPFLNGIIAVGNMNQINDAASLISAIRKYGTVELRIY